MQMFFNAGRGKYSPLQEYLLFKYYIKDYYKPTVLVMNLYTGNDFYDLIRVDDRPYFQIESDGNIKIKPPVWILFKNPERGNWLQESRTLGLLHTLMSKLGQPRLITRIQLLSKASYEEGGGFARTLRYLNDIRNSVEPRLDYSGAYSAQILNQAIFLEKYFPASLPKSKKFLKHLLHIIRMENPGLILVMSPIPSAVLADRVPFRELFSQTLERISMDYEDVFKFEEDLYNATREASLEEGWIFIDNLEIMKKIDSKELYNTFDLHINKEASQAIGEEQAKIIYNILKTMQ